MNEIKGSLGSLIILILVVSVIWFIVKKDKTKKLPERILMSDKEALKQFKTTTEAVTVEEIKTEDIN